MKTLVLTQRDVASLLTMEAAVPAVEAAFRAHGRGEALMPPKVYVALEAEGGDFRAMPAYIAGAAGVKWVNSHPNNPARYGLPSVMGLYVLSDPANAFPLAVMDGTLLTAYRTGAAAAVASKYLAKPSPKTLGLVGCGVQARYLLDAHRHLYGAHAFEVLCADSSPEAATRFAAEWGGRAVSLEEASGADIVCTSTPSREPVVRRAWVRPGAHVNAMGADAPGKQELDPALLDHARVVIDDYEQATHSGEINVPIERRAFDPAHIAATLGEIVARRRPGRANADEITIFDSTGLAVQDVALARALYDLARSKHVGLELALVTLD
jgi:alanine dehydrogenase